MDSATLPRNSVSLPENDVYALTIGVFDGMNPIVDGTNSSIFEENSELDGDIGFFEEKHAVRPARPEACQKRLQATMDNLKTEAYTRNVKPHNAYKAKRELLVLGVAFIVIPIILMAFVCELFFERRFPFYAATDRNEISLVFLFLLIIAAFLWLAALVMLRSRKYLRDESPNASVAEQAVCAECKGTFEIQNMVAHGRFHVCARCKPIFLQKLAEGALPK